MTCSTDDLLVVALSIWKLKCCFCYTDVYFFSFFQQPLINGFLFYFSVVLDTNRWYHKTLITGNDLSITIGSEFDWSCKIIKSSILFIGKKLLLWFSSYVSSSKCYLLQKLWLHICYYIFQVVFIVQCMWSISNQCFLCC